MVTCSSVVVHIMLMYGIVCVEISSCPYLKQAILSDVGGWGE
jgi:hypothetical protein